MNSTNHASKRARWAAGTLAAFIVVALGLCLEWASLQPSPQVPDVQTSRSGVEPTPSQASTGIGEDVARAGPYRISESPESEPPSAQLEVVDPRSYTPITDCVVSIELYQTNGVPSPVPMLTEEGTWRVVLPGMKPASGEVTVTHRDYLTCKRQIALFPGSTVVVPLTRRAADGHALAYLRGAQTEVIDDVRVWGASDEPGDPNAARAKKLLWAELSNEVVEVREATDEEKNHGHPHPGGSCES